MKNSTKKKLFSVLLSSISLFAFSQTTPQQKFHDTKGNIEVTGAGQLQYTMNIDTPPGVKGMTPKVSLVYNSSGRSGIAGYNWNISGLTAISRIGKNLEKDGITKGVQLDYSDFYSFNGQRLILKSGEYGKDGAEYVTEKYSNIKIKSIGSISGEMWKGPEYWEVTYENGSKEWYGAITSGASMARTPIDYNIVKQKDIDGNYISYEYSLNENTAVISRIQWGGNEMLNKPHFNKIEFIYPNSPNRETAYIKGIPFVQQKILESVVVFSNGNQYKNYNISYVQDVQQTKYRYIDNISVFNSNGENSNPVKFTYDQPVDYTANGWIIFNQSNSTSLQPNRDTDVVGDFDGDGKLDMLRYHAVTSARIPQTGVYLYKDFYSITYNTENPIYINSSLQGLKDFIPINFKKTSLIHNRQGLVGYKKITNSSTGKKDLEFSFYTVSDNNTLILDFTKIIPDIERYNSDPDEFDPIGTSLATILGLTNVDLNGDGLNELILQMNYRICTNSTTDPNNPLVGMRSSSGNTFNTDSENILPGQTCNNFKKYIVIDLDETIQNDDWHYTVDLYPTNGEDPFKTYKIGDFDGSGIIDFLKLDSNNKPQLITFSKNSQNKYVSNIAPFKIANDQILEGSWSDAVVGDFNGDGLSDLLIPKTSNSGTPYYGFKLWNKYISRADGFDRQDVKFIIPQTNRTVNKDFNDNVKISNPTVICSYDINNDGKSEVIGLQSTKGYTKSSTQDNNQSVKYNKSASVIMTVLSSTDGFYTVESNTFYITGSYGVGGTVYLNENNINSEFAPNSEDMIGLSADQWTGGMLKRMVFVSAVPMNHDFGKAQRVFSQSFFDLAKGARIKKIEQGGITTEITYKKLDKTINPGLYDGVKTENYPYVEINQSSGMYVVSDIQQTTSSNKKLRQDFRYRGLTSNILGRGMIGFRQSARSSWYTEGFENTKIWSGLEIDPLNEGVPVKEWSIRTNSEANIFPADISENNTQLLSFKSSTYQVDKLLNGQPVTIVPDADKAKVVTAIVPKTKKAKDFLTNTVAENTITYGQYYLPVQSISKINTSYSVKTSDYIYTHNPSGTGSDYYIGRVTSKTESVSAYGDTKSEKEEYTYENNRLKTLKKWNWGNTAYALETFTYDGFGNIIQKVSGNSMDSQTITSSWEYSNDGRFVVKQTDNLGLQTNISYNDNGQVVIQTDPFDNSITNSYDAWGKLVSSESSLGGITTYQYEKDNNLNVTVTQNDPDGNVSKKFTNKFGQVYKTSTKAFGQGQFVSQETQYDALGRKISESEPYFEGQSPSQWNSIAYDDTVYPTKVTTTAFNGRQTESKITGSTTTVKELNGYGRTTTKTTDALGNVVSTTDKGGTIQFSYNAAGQQIKAKYGENSVVTKYDSWGRKSEFNDPSNGVYQYEYDGFGRAKKTISPKGTKEYTYNNFGQLVSQKEFSTIDGGQSTDKMISFTYSPKGLLTAKSGVVSGQTFSSAFTYDPHGRLLSSTENSNGRTYSHKGLTYDQKGRVVSYEKELISSGMTTTANLENIYSDWSGELSEVRDANSGKTLWKLTNTNAKGQTLEAKLGAVDINNSYDANGFLTEIHHSSVVKPKLLEVYYSFNAIKNELVDRKTLGDFNIIESFDYDDNNRLINWTDPVTGVKPSANRNVYDVKGRIMDNDQVGVMKYENSAKIYQPTGMTLNQQGAENYNGDLIQKISYNENNDPVFIDGEKGDVGFMYGLTAMRQKMSYGGNFEPGNDGAYSKFYSENGSFEIVRNNETGSEKHIIYIGGTPYESSIIYLKDYKGEKGSYKFLHKDYLGSILAISDADGNKLEQRHFDAWGNLTHLQIGKDPVITEKNKIATTYLLIDRGYTSHEHLSEVSIIHMNGRLYDPLLRRFLNADENIQDPTNTQNYNKYGYVMNNPMMYSDPDGEFWWWFAGALAGGYISGVQANGGQLNPVKWDWQNTWSAVLGGAIGGAAISGSLGNITSNPGAIKSMLPGIVSGGLSSAFSGSNFLSGTISGIGFTSTVFDNRITSTNLNSASRTRSIRASGTGTGAGETFEDYLYSIGVPTYEMIDIEEVVLKGRRGEDAYNSYLMASKITGALGDWNFQQNRAFFYNEVHRTKADVVERNFYLMFGGMLLSPFVGSYVATLTGESATSYLVNSLIRGGTDMTLQAAIKGQIDWKQTMINAFIGGGQGASAVKVGWLNYGGNMINNFGTSFYDGGRKGFLKDLGVNTTKAFTGMFGMGVANYNGFTSGALSGYFGTTLLPGLYFNTTDVVIENKIKK
ncbi:MULTISPECIES: RHS repeat-associated core domain-containing protein [unclassified Chryseobacterium]|uniref:RHS repeat-associated core domain-containing protein n=1 Tax=unclassified Chryseobacterium TaxID=2593645 RepID=UPI000D35F8F5|nr:MULTISPECIES: RHS repeat-associated core domain-containing protein [unclassified Chryseobacterium]PTT77272.1 type IV secretion protein Rhs [Chryseobacterium sp. HMWF001]PVV57019.1 type IV secretion protein Rhs [Chryseobacterium sp. HMWF035]